MEIAIFVLSDLMDENSTTIYDEEVIHDALLTWAAARRNLNATKLARTWASPESAPACG